LKRKLVIVAMALIAVTVGAVVAVTTVTQNFPPIGRTPIQVTTFCPNLGISPDTPIPPVGTAGTIRFQCEGSAAAEPVLCSNWSSGHDCAFYVGDSAGGGGGLATPTFTLPSGYVHIWVKGAGIDPSLPIGQQDELHDCNLFNNNYHWLNGDGSHPVELGNISHVYCATVDSSTAQLTAFSVSWS